MTDQGYRLGDLGGIIYAHTCNGLIDSLKLDIDLDQEIEMYQCCAEDLSTAVRCSKNLDPKAQVTFDLIVENYRFLGWDATPMDGGYKIQYMDATRILRRTAKMRYVSQTGHYCPDNHIIMYLGPYTPCLEGY